MDRLINHKNMLRDRFGGKLCPFYLVVSVGIKSTHKLVYAFFELAEISQRSILYFIRTWKGISFMDYDDG